MITLSKDFVARLSDITDAIHKRFEQYVSLDGLHRRQMVRGYWRFGEVRVYSCRDMRQALVSTAQRGDECAAWNPEF